LNELIGGIAAVLASERGPDRDADRGLFGHRTLNFLRDSDKCDGSTQKSWKTLSGFSEVDRPAF
jgi:hypothetical protein